jgi:biopolymer transport protein ExbB/TolQ
LSKLSPNCSYLVWVIPTLGFIGTVVGISLALMEVNPEAPNLRQLTASLGISFYTTLVALGQSAILVLLMSGVQTREELSTRRMR